MMRLPAPTLRWRWALWCAGLVTATGIVVVVVLLSVTSRMLRDRNAEANGLPTDPAAQQQRQQPGLPQVPGQRPLPGQPPASATGQPNDQLRRGGIVADETFRDTRTLGIAMVAGLAALSLAVGWFVAGRMVRPLADITVVADEVAGGRFGQRIRLEGPSDELKRLADTFDLMLDRLDAAFGAQRAFVADASHELRTPLTVMRAEIDVALDDPTADADALREALTATSDALARTTRLVESLLALSRSEVLAHVEDHDLADSLERSVATHLAGRAQVEVITTAAPVRGDGVLLDRIVDNLVSNAARYTPADGYITIATGIDDNVVPMAFVRVTNEGPVLTADEVQRLSTRFHRRDGRRNPHAGAGLGLAIVESAVATHGGTVTIEARPLGGLDVVVRLPAARESTGNGQG